MLFEERFKYMDIELCKKIDEFFGGNVPDSIAPMWWHKNKTGHASDSPEFDYCISPRMDNSKTIWSPICRAYNYSQIINLLQLAIDRGRDSVDKA